MFAATKPRWQMKPPVGSKLDRGHPLAKYVGICWLANEGAGANLNDISGNYRTGTLTSIGTNFNWSPGAKGIGLAGPGNNASAGGATTPIITTGTTFSMEAWIKWNFIGGYSQIAGQTGTPGLFQAAGKLNWYQSGDHFGTTTMIVGQLYHCIFSVLAGVGTFYLNGRSDGTVASVLSINLTDFFGNASNQCLSGALDLFRYYPGYALTANDALSLYADEFGMIANPSAVRNPSRIWAVSGGATGNRRRRILCAGSNM